MTKLINTATAAKSMPDESGSADEATATESSKRKQVSKRGFLAKDGSEAERMEEASGARYTLLDPNGNHDLDYQFGADANADRMFAIFGFHTKIGNVANTVLNDKEEPGTPTDAAARIKEFLDSVKAGTWAEKSEGVGQKVDKQALAAAVVEVMAAKGKPLQLGDVMQWLEEGKPELNGKPAMTAQAFMRAVRQDRDVADAYATRVGKATRSVDDLI